MSYTDLTVTNLLTLGNQLKIEVQNWDDIIIYGIQGMQTGDDPVLYLSNASLLADNDIMVYGSIGTMTDPSKQSGGGALIIGHGWKGSKPSGAQEPIALTPPLIELWTSGTLIKSGPSLPNSNDMSTEAGQLFYHTPAGGPNVLKIWTGSSWITSETNSSGYYDTLFLVKNDGYNPAHLDLGNLTAHGNVSIVPSLGANAVFTLNATAENYIRFNDGTVSDYLGMAHGSNQLVYGSTQGDLVIRAANKRILFTTNDGANIGTSLDTSGNLTAAGWVHPSNSLWGMVCSGDVMYLGKQGVTNGLSIDTSGNALAAGMLQASGWNVGANNSIHIGYAGEGIIAAYATSGSWTSSTLSLYAQNIKLQPQEGGVVTDTGHLSVYGDINCSGKITLGTSNYLQWGSDTYLSRPSANVLSVNNGAGGLGTLNTSNLFTDHINSATGQGIYAFDHIKLTTTHLIETQQDMVFDKYDTSNGRFWWRTNYNSGDISSYVDIMNLDSAGTLRIAGNLYVGGLVWYNDGGYMRTGSSLITNGTMTVASNGSTGSGSALYFDSSRRITQGSSLRDLKTSIETLDDASWIYNLRPVTFDWKDEKDAQVFGRQIGLIAEDVQPIAPLLTFNDDQTGKLRGIMYEKLAVPMLVEMQKLRREVDELKAKLAAA